MTSQDVENYKQIKSDLDQLRSIVEKSELWVYKRQGEDGMDGDGPSESDNKKKVRWKFECGKVFLNVELLLKGLIIDSWFTGRFRQEEDWKYQQLQLQSCKRGIIVCLLSYIFILDLLLIIKMLLLCVSVFFRSCCASVSCVSRREAQGKRAGNSSRGCWGTWELTVWC